ncbi:hypothetical protein ACOSQ4_031709 [Xanthoceras sorbifolium]
MDSILYIREEDIDSVVLGNPLPKEVITSSVLGGKKPIEYNSGWGGKRFSTWHGEASEESAIGERGEPSLGKPPGVLPKDLILLLKHEESERGVGPLSTMFPHQREQNWTTARHIMAELEISEETDAENLREWRTRIREDKNLLKGIIREYLPTKKASDPFPEAKVVEAKGDNEAPQAQGKGGERRMGMRASFA